MNIQERIQFNLDQISEEIKSRKFDLNSDLGLMSEYAIKAQRKSFHYLEDMRVVWDRIQKQKEMLDMLFEKRKTLENLQ